MLQDTEMQIIYGGTKYIEHPMIFYNMIPKSYENIKDKFDTGVIADFSITFLLHR
jgi:hypothetical protein